MEDAAQFLAIRAMGRRANVRRGSPPDVISQSIQKHGATSAITVTVAQEDPMTRRKSRFILMKGKSVVKRWVRWRAVLLELCKVEIDQMRLDARSACPPRHGRRRTLVQDDLPVERKALVRGSPGERPAPVENLQYLTHVERVGKPRESERVKMVGSASIDDQDS